MLYGSNTEITRKITKIIYTLLEYAKKSYVFYPRKQHVGNLLESITCLVLYTSNEVEFSWKIVQALSVVALAWKGCSKKQMVTPKDTKKSLIYS